MKYITLSKNPHKFYRFTGVALETFEKLAQQVEPLWQEAEQKRLSHSERKRAIGAGGKYKLVNFRDKLLVALLYYRLYLTYEILQEFFNVHYSNLNRLVNRLESLLMKRIKTRIPKVLKKRIGTWEEFCEVYPDLVDIVIDATEQRLQRPKGWKRQKKYYSGKGKKHAMKTQITVSKRGKILCVSQSVPASIHDYSLLKESTIMDCLPEKATKHFDLGYLGVSDDFPEHICVIPKRKPRKKELSIQEKRENRRKARTRIIVEHTIARLKKFQILYQTYRNQRKSYNKKFQIVAGLVNLRLGFAA
jgi:DDE superfamily endonuclease/Helix-turn-helix of DDE superfamily endonuclease